jgi:hypothetical protein
LSQVLVNREDYYTDLMKRFGPKDVTYAVLYDAKDAKYIAGLDPNFLHQKIEERYNDHIGLPQFIDIAKADDIVSYPGLGHVMRLILGITATRFWYMCSGQGLDKPTPFQQNLIDEKTPRIDMTTSGTIVRSGSTIIRFTANYPASHQTMTVRESGINTSPTFPNTGIFLNRNEFAASDIVHTANVTGFTLQTDITFTGV